MDQQIIRTAMLLGVSEAESLRLKHVAVFGIGGVGSFCAEALARAGVGTLTLIDDDVVSESNINRQLIALHSTVGQLKTEVMAQRIQDINPKCKVITKPFRYEADNRELFFSDIPDYIADCIDSVPCKTDLIATSITKDIPIISAMGTGNKLDPAKFEITDLSKTSGCPLARTMRRELKKLGIIRHTVLYSTEQPVQTAFQPDDSRVIPGSVSWVPSCAGLLIAGHIIKNLISMK